VDLDHVIDNAGMLLPQAQEVVEKLASYTEISPSGTGMHIFVISPGANITNHRKKDFFLEIYNTGRYFTVTGNIYGSARAIETRTAELQAIHDKYLLSDATHKVMLPPPSISVPSAEHEKFLQTGLERDKILRALWDGERRNGNESADDQALMNKLAYWCNANPSVMIQAFLSSPHYAGKDESHKKKCQRADYLPKTAQKACITVCSTAKADSDRWQQNRRRQRSSAR
jgi:putative DNA primase/helicase